MNYLLVLFVAIGPWFMQTNNGYSRIVNQGQRSIDCYVYYRDGDVSPIRVRAMSASHWFYSVYVSNVECY